MAAGAPVWEKNDTDREHAFESLDHAYLNANRLSADHGVRPHTLLAYI